MTRPELVQAIPPAYTHYLGITLRGALPLAVYPELEASA